MTKNEAVSKLLDWCRAQLGYPEGADNWNKYAEDPDLAKLLGWKPQKQPWCDLWTDEGFIVCFGLDAASKMTYQPIGHGSAACRYSAQFFKDNGAFTQSPEPGDVIFFCDDEGVINHQGIVEKVSGGVVHTIEGNSADRVQRCAYAVGSIAIAGYGRPKWSVVTDQNADGQNSADEVVVEPQKGIEGLPELKRGMTGEVVRAAQYLLNGRGASVGYYGADGDFGPQTEAAVLAYQRRLNREDKSIIIDGIIGPVTWAKLLGVS